MPYNPSTDVYSLPAIYLAIPGTTIIAAQHNDPLVDLQTANNYARPVVAGGTGANNATSARANLGVVSSGVAVTYVAPTVDNVLPRWNGTAGALQDSAISVADNGDSVQESTDAGATAGPVDDLYRNSASPLALDIIGTRQWTGEDSAGNKEIYAEDRVQILDPTSGSEDAKIVSRTVVAGGLADRQHVGAGMWMEGATDGDKGAGTVNATWLYRNGGAIQPLLHLRDQKASGTDGGTFTSGAWRTRDLNTEVTDEIGSTLAANQFTLPAGTYEIQASAPAFGGDKHQTKLFNVTDATDVIIGTGEFTAVAGTGGNDTQNRSFISGRFTIAAQKTFEIRHQINTTQSTTGFGNAVGFGVVEVYTDVMIWRVT